MKFTVTGSELAKAVSYLSPIVDDKSSNQGMRHVRISKFNDDQIEIKAFNEHANGSCFLNVENLEGDCTAYVLKKSLFPIISSFAGEVDITIGDTVIVKSGKSKYKMATFDEETFKSTSVPEIEYYDIKFGEPIKMSSFQTKLKTVLHCLSQDDSRMELKHIFVKDVGDKCVMIACDGTHGAIIECSDEYKRLDGCMIASELANAILKIETSNDISFYCSDNILYIKTNDFISGSSISDLSYPFEYINQIYEASLSDDGFVLDVEIHPEATDRAIGRLLNLTDPETNSVKASFANKRIAFSVDENNSGNEEVSLTNKLDKRPKDFSVYVDGKRLREAIKKTVGLVKWRSIDPQEVQYICDSESTQFFLGLDS